MIFQIRQTIDIKKDNPVLEYKQGLDYGNNLAHEWLVFVEEDGALVDLASVAVTGYFLREDGVTVKVDGSVKNGACSVVFDRRCYLVEGAVKCAMVLTRGAEVVTSAKLRTNANQNITDQIIDTGDTIPTDIYDLLTQIDAMREATAATVAATVEANTAAERANAGAERAEQLQIDASGLAGDSNRLGGKPPEYYLPVQNLLINPDFAIAQAGYNGLHGTKMYLADRWVGSPGQVTFNNRRITFTADYETATQKIGTDVRGKTCTFAVKARNVSGIVNLSVHNGSAVSGSNDVRMVEGITILTCYFSADSTDPTFVLWGLAGSSFDIEWAAAYDGTYTADTMPPYVPPDATLELAKCRYFFRVYKANQCSFSGFALNGVLYMDVTFDTEMRAAPSLANSGLLYSENANASSSGNAECHITGKGRIRIKSAASLPDGAHHITPLFDVMLSADL